MDATMYTWHSIIENKINCYKFTFSFLYGAMVCHECQLLQNAPMSFSVTHEILIQQLLNVLQYVTS